MYQRESQLSVCQQDRHSLKILVIIGEEKKTKKNQPKYGRMEWLATELMLGMGLGDPPSGWLRGTVLVREVSEQMGEGT